SVAGCASSRTPSAVSPSSTTTPSRGCRRNRPPRSPPATSPSGVASRPDGDALERQPDLRRDEPGSVVVVLRPDVADDDDRPVVLDRPARFLRGLLECRLVLAELEALG